MPIKSTLSYSCRRQPRNREAAGKQPRPFVCGSGRRYLRARATNSELVRVRPRGRVGCGSPPPAPTACAGGPRHPLDLSKSNSATPRQNSVFAARAGIPHTRFPLNLSGGRPIFSFARNFPKPVPACACGLRQIFRGLVSPCLQTAAHDAVRCLVDRLRRLSRDARHNPSTARHHSRDGAAAPI